MRISKLQIHTCFAVSSLDFSQLILELIYMFLL